MYFTMDTDALKVNLALAKKEKVTAKVKPNRFAMD